MLLTYKKLVKFIYVCIIDILVEEV